LGEGKVIAGEMAVEDPVASLFGRYFTVRTDKRRIDHSWSVGELEHLQRDAVIEYLRMPERVKQMEKNFTVFTGKFEELTSALSKLFSVEGQDARSIQEGQRRLQDYVS
jgi:hypothetical protein